MGFTTNENGSGFVKSTCRSYCDFHERLMNNFSANIGLFSISISRRTIAQRSSGRTGATSRCCSSGLSTTEAELPVSRRPRTCSSIRRPRSCGTRSSGPWRRSRISIGSLRSSRGVWTVRMHTWTGTPAFKSKNTNRYLNSSIPSLEQCLEQLIMLSNQLRGESNICSRYGQPSRCNSCIVVGFRHLIGFCKELSYVYVFHCSIL